MAIKFVEMTARKRSSCARCDEWIKPGDRITWETPAGLASHVECPIDEVGARGDDDELMDYAFAFGDFGDH